MMADYFANRYEPKSLTAQIRIAERQVLSRQRQVGVRTDTLISKTRRQMTAPTTILLAGGVGFIIGELTGKRLIPNSRGTDDKPGVTETSPLRVALNLMASVHTLYTALPLAWMMKSFYQPAVARESSRKKQKIKNKLPASDYRG